MTLGAVRAGDIVLAERRGWRFYAIVLARRERVLEVEPIDRRVSYHMVKAREVLGIWHKSRSRRGRASSEVAGLNGSPSGEETVRSEAGSARPS
jgi:hypothetical protein